MSTQKTLLIINLRDDAIERAIPFQTAKRMGLTVVFLGDKDPLLPAGLIDYMLLTDTYDMPAAVEALDAFVKANHLRIDGVTTWADRDVELVAKVGQHFDIPALSPEAARKVRNKYFLRHALSVADDLSPRYHSVKNKDEFRAAIEDIGYPCVFKPTGASASTGIFLLNSDDEAKWAWERMMEIADPNVYRVFTYYPSHFIVEEFLDGPEYSVEGLIHNGEVHIAAVTDKWTTEPYKLEVQHILPSGHPQEWVDEIKAKTKRVVQILDLDNCPFHLECKYTSHGMRVIEIAGRPGGDNIASHLIHLATGVNFHEQIIRNALGEKVNMEQPLQRFAGMRKFVAKEEGVVTSVIEPEGELPTDLIDYSIWVKPGDRTMLPPNSFAKQLMGYVLAVGETYEQVQVKLMQYADLVQITVEAPETAEAVLQEEAK